MRLLARPVSTRKLSLFGHAAGANVGDVGAKVGFRDGLKLLGFLVGIKVEGLPVGTIVTGLLDGIRVGK